MQVLSHVFHTVSCSIALLKAFTGLSDCTGHLPGCLLVSKDFRMAAILGFGVFWFGNIELETLIVILRFPYNATAPESPPPPHVPSLAMNMKAPMLGVLGALLGLWLTRYPMSPKP